MKCDNRLSPRCRPFLHRWLVNYNFSLLWWEIIQFVSWWWLVPLLFFRRPKVMAFFPCSEQDHVKPCHNKRGVMAHEWKEKRTQPQGFISWNKKSSWKWRTIVKCCVSCGMDDFQSVSPWHQRRSSPWNNPTPFILWSLDRYTFFL